MVAGLEGAEHLHHHTHPAHHNHHSHPHRRNRSFVHNCCCYCCCSCTRSSPGIDPFGQCILDQASESSVSGHRVSVWTTVDIPICHLVHHSAFHLSVSPWLISPWLISPSLSSWWTLVMMVRKYSTCHIVPLLILLIQQLTGWSSPEVWGKTSCSTTCHDERMWRRHQLWHRLVRMRTFERTLERTLEGTTCATGVGTRSNPCVWYVSSCQSRWHGWRLNLAWWWCFHNSIDGGRQLRYWWWCIVGRVVRRMIHHQLIRNLNWIHDQLSRNLNWIVRCTSIRCHHVWLLTKCMG